MSTLVLIIDGTGTVRCLYSELIDLTTMGRLQITRASTIEFSEVNQTWEVRKPNGDLLFTHPSRAQCLAWEQLHLSP